jgi:hypothetical protein
MMGCKNLPAINSSSFFKNTPEIEMVSMSRGTKPKEEEEASKRKRRANEGEIYMSMKGSSIGYY